VLTVLLAGIDTLEVSFRGELKKGLVETLDKLKRRAQQSNIPEAFVVDDTAFVVQAKGLPPWSYVLTNEELHLRASASPSVPCVSVRLTAFGLAYRGHEALWEQAQELAGRLGAEDAGVSRLDLAVDFQGHVPTFEEMRGAVCASGFRPIYPNTEHPETFQFGKDEVVVRLYNKTRELHKSGKRWLEDVWQRDERYRPGEDVWRFEVQFRREVLRALGCHSVEKVFESLEGLLAVGLYWVSPREETESNLSRCEVQAWWDELMQASFAGQPLPRVKETKQVAGLARHVPQMLGLLVSAAASVGVTDLATALDLQGEAMELYITRRGKPFAVRVRERQRVQAH
jgi:hypothetical protein